jgi:hypothetical protein
MNPLSISIFLNGKVLGGLMHLKWILEDSQLSAEAKVGVASLMVGAMISDAKPLIEQIYRNE